jgi:hypothetical protein
MCAFIFYFACRSHAAFKFKFESNEFAICKKIQKIKRITIFSKPNGPKSSFNPGSTQPADLFFFPGAAHLATPSL